MNKRMEELRVFTTSNGMVALNQGNREISIQPEQVDLVVKWLREAERELASRIRSAETKAAGDTVTQTIVKDLLK